MASQNQNFGIMDEGYFVSRSDILVWINDLLKVNLTKIEELGSGAVYCQIVDAIYPGKVAMGKVNWKAKNDYQFISNYKILQNAFEKLGVKRYVEVEKLSKAKYQDNLQFAQWLKRYYDVNCAEKDVPYSAEERRGPTKIDFGFADKIVVPKNFNATGQIISTKRVGSREKRAESGASGKESAKRLASPINDKVPRPKNSSNQKRGSIIQHKQVERIKKPPLPSHNLPPTTPQSQRAKVQQKQQTDETFRPSKTNLQQLQKYKKTVRDLQAKIEMITEVTQAGDDPETKLKLIEEILSIDVSKYSKVSEFSHSHKPQESAFRHIDTMKTEQIKEEINHEWNVHQVSYEPKHIVEESSVGHSTSKTPANEEDQEVF